MVSLWSSIYASPRDSKGYSKKAKAKGLKGQKIKTDLGWYGTVVFLHFMFQSLC